MNSLRSKIWFQNCCWASEKLIRTMIIVIHWIWNIKYHLVYWKLLPHWKWHTFLIFYREKYLQHELNLKQTNFTFLCLIFLLSVCPRDATRKNIARFGGWYRIHNVRSPGRSRSIGDQFNNGQRSSFATIWHVHIGHGLLWYRQQQSYSKAFAYCCKYNNIRKWNITFLEYP